MKSLIILLLSFILINPTINAIEPTPSTISDKIEDVKGIVKQIVKSTSGEDDITETVSDNPKSFFGNITQINDNTITINYKSQNQLIEVSDETVYVDLKRNKSKLTNFKVGQEILAMGYLNGDKSLDCKRIVATEMKSVVNNNQTITGQIVDNSKETSIFTLSPNYNKNSPFQIKTDSKTDFVDINNEKITSTKVIINGKKIIAIISPDAKLAQTFYATKVIILDSSNDETGQSILTPSPTQ